MRIVIPACPAVCTQLRRDVGQQFAHEWHSRAVNRLASGVDNYWRMGEAVDRLASVNKPVCRESRRSPVVANSTRPIGRSSGSKLGDERPDTEYQNSSRRDMPQL